MTPNEQFDAKADAIRRAKRTDAARCIILAEPEVLFGWTGTGLDLAQYAKKNYPHPRHASYYSLDSDRIKELAAGITISNDTDPIEVFLDQDMEELIVLDGASRCAALALIRMSNPDAFKRIRMQVFRGNRESALGRMVSANMEDRRTSLTLIEISTTCGIYKAWGWSLEEICERLGKPESWKPELSRILKLSEAAPELIEQIKAGTICKTSALDLASEPPSVQRDVAADLAAGKKVTKGSIRRAKRSHAEANGKTLPGRKLQPWKNIDKTADWLSEDFNDWLEAEQPDDIECIMSAKSRAFSALNELANLVRPEITR